LIAGAYVLREGLNVARRYLVENTCSRLTYDMTLHLVAHLMTVALDRLSRKKVGAVHARMIRGVDGLIRFLRLSFLDYFPALATGMIALGAAPSKSWLLARTCPAGSRRSG
jgi:ATP-binding cassette, subfamily B, bacterial